MRKGFFIIFDGPSATGKDTITKQLLDSLQHNRPNVFSYEEVTSPEYDRQAILKAKDTMDNKIIALAFIKERKKLYESLVIPKLAGGAIVIGNRGEPSTLAYQSLGETISIEDIWNLHRENKIQLPDLIILTTCSVEEALRRESLRENTIRKTLSGKFTTVEKRKTIHEQYKKVRDFLVTKGVSVLEIDTEKVQPNEAVKKLLPYII